jgi:succinyl-diaminopimelate desuccinylase
MNQEVDVAIERILKELKVKEDEITSQCSQLIRIPSENPPGITTDLASYIKDILQDKGISVSVYEPQKGKPNLVATIGDGEHPHLVLNAHMDEFPAGEVSWDAFSGKISGGRIIGRGASDMKGGLTASLVAFYTLHECCEKIPGRITLTLVSDEETGGIWGTGWLLENVPDLAGDACVIGEATGVGVVAIGEKGACRLKVKTVGASYHAAHGKGENAIEKMAAAIPLMLKLRSLRGSFEGYGQDFLRLLKREEELLKGEYPNPENILEYAVVNLGTIKGGVKVNVVPATCDLELDVRPPFGVSSKDVMQKLAVDFEKAALSGVTCEPMFGSEGNYTPLNEEIVELTVSSVRQVTGEGASVFPIRIGGTDARFYRLKRVPTVIYGPEDYNMGGIEEHITIADLTTVTKVHAALALQFVMRGAGTSQG